MITLSREPSSRDRAFGMFREGELIFSESFTADRSHSSELFAVIERALAGREAPGQIVVGLGPGSYAGVRIAIAAGIGISVASGAEMVGVPSIAGLDEGEYLAVGDARRGGYWVANLKEGEIVSGPEILTREGMEQRLAGTGLPVYSSEEVGFAGVALRFPDVERIGRLGIAGRGVIARGALEPMYLREPHITNPKGIKD